MIEFRRCFPRVPRVITPFRERKERRIHPRRTWPKVIHFAVENCVYKALIQNISAGGALIRTRGSFLPGQKIAMSFRLPFSREHIRTTCKIAWAGQLETGVKFRYIEPRGRDLDFFTLDAAREKPISFGKEFRRMGRVRKKRVRWQPSTSADVSRYRLYWSERRELNYNSDYIELDKVTEIILPDDITSFPLVAGEMELGVTAINEAGNESDITKLTAYFNFAVPDAPQNLEVEDI